jgi:primary-amine oxidase
VAGIQIVAVSLAVRHHLAAHTSIKAIRFLTNYLLPPPKRAVLAHLGIPLATGETVKDEDRVPIARKAEVDVSRTSSYNSLFDACGNRVTCTEPPKPVLV